MKTSPLTEQGTPGWAAEFVASMPISDLFELLQAADELQFEGLTAFMAAVIAHQYLNLPTNIRDATFGMTRALTLEEDALVRAVPEGRGSGL